MAVALAIVAATLVIGCLIGCVGVGGVLLTPALTYLAGYDVHVAMATSMWAFVFTGIAGTAVYARRGTLDWRGGGWLCAAAIPGALAGAWANGLLSQDALKLLLAILLVVTGLQTARSRPAGHARARPGAPVMAAIGLATGFGSALTGTGGPILIVPALLLLGTPALTAVGIGNLAQLPVAGSGTVGFLLAGEVDLRLGAGLGVLAAVGVVAGVAIAHAVPGALLRRAVAVACTVAGIAIGIGQL